jgi:hypothetical protein
VCVCVKERENECEEAKERGEPSRERERGETAVQRTYEKVIVSVCV